LNLPILIQHLYGKFTFTGLYSFEFVDKNRNTITEIFFMIPPKSKNVSEPTRSTTNPTLGGNYNTDAGNGTKTITLTGELYFPYIGSPDNPVARDNANLKNTIDGLNEFFKLRYILMRYRDYTLTRNAQIYSPASVLSLSKETNTLYKKIAKNIKEKIGALYDEVKLIFHDYDMDDHWYCRIDNFSSNQSSEKYIAIEYTINMECSEPDYGQKRTMSVTQKKQTNESVDIFNTQIQNINFSDKLSAIQGEISYNNDFLATSLKIENYIENINTENEKIQSGKSYPLNVLPTYVSNAQTELTSALSSFITTFLSTSQKVEYENNDLTIDDVVNIDLSGFYNALLKLKIFINSIQGMLNSIVRHDELRYYSNANDYKLTSDQFDSQDENIIENNTNFYFYTVLEGDTARKIALCELKDQEKFISILKINNISENDFIDGTIIGQKIKIPYNATTITRGDDNLVYDNNPDNIEKFLFGTDVASDVNKNILMSPTGDILGKSGILNVYDSIENRIKNKKGSLNIFNPNWGTVPISDGNVPFVVNIQRYLSDLISQIQSDPRVKSVDIDLDRLVINGESVSVYSTVEFVGTNEKIEVTNV
jgi:hypothetical protein